MSNYPSNYPSNSGPPMPPGGQNPYQHAQYQQQAYGYGGYSAYNMQQYPQYGSHGHVYRPPQPAYGYGYQQPYAAHGYGYPQQPHQQPQQQAPPMPPAMHYQYAQQMQVSAGLQAQQYRLLQDMGLVTKDPEEENIDEVRRKEKLKAINREEDAKDPEELQRQAEERAAKAEARAKELQDKLMSDDGLKTELRDRFIDELMRRQEVCGSFEITHATIFPFKEYDEADPVAQWYATERHSPMEIFGKRWDPLYDSEYLRNGIKGFGTDEKKIINVCATRCNQQRNRIYKEYKTAYGRDLIKDLSSDLSGHFRTLVIGLFETPARYDAYCIKKAIYGAGTDERALIEILMTRTNAQIQETVEQYNCITYEKQSNPESSLEIDIENDCSGHFKRLLISASTANRRKIDRERLADAVEEVLNDDIWTGMFQVNYDKLVDVDLCKNMAQELFTAGEDRWGTDDETFNRIFSTSDFYTLRRTYDEYVRISQRDIMNSVDRETHGSYKKGLLAIAQSVKCRPMFFAERLYRSMKGVGTKDTQLIRIVSSRAEMDLVEIKQCFLDKFQQTVWNFIEHDCSGDYKRLLQAIVGRD